MPRHVDGAEDNVDGDDDIDGYDDNSMTMLSHFLWSSLSPYENDWNDTHEISSPKNKC